MAQDCGASFEESEEISAIDGAEISHIHVALCFRDQGVFEGTSTLQVRIVHPVDSLLLHSGRGVTVRGAKCTQNKKQLEMGWEPPAGPGSTLTATFPGGLAVGKATLVIGFSTALGPELHGIYKAPRTGGGSMVLTHFEPQFARDAFVCVDSFMQRPRWTFSLTVPSSTTHILGNMPVASRSPAPAGHVTVTFQETPPMPAYLAAFCVAEGTTWEYISKPYRSCVAADSTVTVSVLAPKGSPVGASLLENTLRGLALFEAEFDISYGLPKLDVALVPRMMLGGMENWGLIFLNEADAVPKGGNKKAGAALLDLLMHELAHQWIGNLVGFPFWIKEGLALHYEQRMGSIVNNRAAPKAAKTGAEAGGSGPDGQEEASQLFNGTTYQRSQRWIAERIAAWGDVAFRDKLRELLAANLHGYVDEPTFLGHFARD